MLESVKSIVRRGMAMENIPLYQQIADSFAKKIQTGVLKNGDRLPSETELMSSFHVSQSPPKKHSTSWRITVTRNVSKAKDPSYKPITLPTNHS